MDNYKLSYSRQQRLKNEEQELDKNVAEIDKSNKFNNSVADIRTTKELSLKEIDNFIGKKSLLKAMSVHPNMAFVCLGFATATVITAILSIVQTLLTHKAIAIDMIALWMFLSLIPAILLSAELVYEMSGAAHTRIRKIEEKTLQPNYVISSKIVDCPIEVKRELYYQLKEGYVYFSYNFYYQTMKYFTESGKEKCVKILDYNDSKIYCSREFHYFRDQLVRDKIYRIADVLTDNAFKEQ